MMELLVDTAFNSSDNLELHKLYKFPVSDSFNTLGPKLVDDLLGVKPTTFPDDQVLYLF